MKISIRYIYHNRAFLLFILLFAYIQSIYTRVSIRQEINAYTFTPEAAVATWIAAGILFSIILFFINRWHNTEAFNTRIMLKIFAVSLLIFIVSMKLIGFVIAFVFGNIERNFNQHSLTISLFSDFLDGFIYGSFFLAYYYSLLSDKH